MSLGLVVALPEEARAVGRALRAGRQVRSGSSRGGNPPVHRLTGKVGEQPVRIAWAGAGTACAARAARALLQDGVDSLFAVGFAGALSPEIRPGDLLLVTEILSEDGTRWPMDPGLLKALALAGPPAGPPFHQGPLVTVPRVVTTAREKYRLGEETGAFAVDMESAAVARCAAEARVPMAAVRAMTDGVDESLPLDFNRCIDSDGQFHHGRLILLLARRPLAVGGLIRLGRHSARAGQALASFLAAALPCLMNVQSPCPSRGPHRPPE